MSKINILVPVFIIFILLSSCKTSIKSIIENPEKYHGKNVKVKGMIRSSMQLNDIKVFTIKDFSGEHITVITQNRIPVFEDNITVKGHVITNFSYHNRDEIIVIKEKTFEKKKSKIEIEFEKSIEDKGKSKPKAN